MKRAVHRLLVYEVMTDKMGDLGSYQDLDQNPRSFDENSSSNSKDDELQDRDTSALAAEDDISDPRFSFSEQNIVDPRVGQGSQNEIQSNVSITETATSTSQAILSGLENSEFMDPRFSLNGQTDTRVSDNDSLQDYNDDNDKSTNLENASNDTENLKDEQKLEKKTTNSAFAKLLGSDSDSDNSTGE